MTRRLIVLFTGALVLGVFAAAAMFYQRPAAPGPAPVPGEASTLVRPHSPVMGPADAAVTIVEFFDPSCEACRAFYPVVKGIMADHAEDVRVVIRYAAFHEGSDEAVRMLEAARRQDKFVPALEALLATQPEWATHGTPPDLERAWRAVGGAGVDLQQARADARRPDFQAILNQDAQDGKTHNVRQTPTFFVNGKPLQEFGARQLEELVSAEVARAKGQ